MVTPVVEDVITVASVGYPPLVVDINDLDPKTSEYGKSEGLVRGVCAYFKKMGTKSVVFMQQQLQMCLKVQV